MLKVLIIDDDRTSRKGIRNLMPWSNYQMEVVGEASNGKEGLDFLRTNKINLVLVDLDMPVMNGIEFIRQASLQYPYLNYVVLTVHTEFEYIQNALRLGVIDYISKNEFDQENFNKILTRIRASLSKKITLQENISSLNWRNLKLMTPDIYALITVNTENVEHIYEFCNKNHISNRIDIYEIQSGIWIFTDEREDFLFPKHFTNTMLLHISDVQDMTYSQLGAILRVYMKDQFFYDYQPIKKINYKHAYELTENKYIVDQEMLESLKAKWLSLNWVNDSLLFNQMKIDLKSSKLRPSNLYQMMLSLTNIWNASYSDLLCETLISPNFFHSWVEVEAWLGWLYEKSNLFYISSQYSQEVIKNILNAKTYIDTHYASALKATEIARRFCMSYGYFSRCFHDIMGISFSDYCIRIRIQQAKTLLIDTQHTLQQISADVGYNDEKYFSRIFKKTTGQAPNEYRRNNNANFQKVNH